MQQSPPANGITVEAGSAESALEEVSRRLGANAEIVDARKVHKGGIGGFFAREMVQITAKPRPGDSHRFGTVLESAMHPQEGDPGMGEADRAATGAAPQSSGEEIPSTPDDQDLQQPTPAPASPPGAQPAEWRLRGGADWSVTALARSDLPGVIAEAVMDLDPRDDLGWIAAIAGAVSPWCRPLPSGSGVMIGEDAGRVGTALEMEVVTPPDMAPYRGEFAAPIAAGSDDLEWLDAVRGERWLHLVVSEGDDTRLLDDRVLAVSWSGDRGIATALRLASSLGLVLGYGVGSEIGAPGFRATPIDVALAVRKLVGRR